MKTEVPALIGAVFCLALMILALASEVLGNITKQEMCQVIHWSCFFVYGGLLISGLVWFSHRPSQKQAISLH